MKKFVLGQLFFLECHNQKKEDIITARGPFGNGFPKIKNKNISFKDVEKILCAPKVVNGELIHDEPSFEEVIEYMHYMMVEEGRQASAG